MAGARAGTIRNRSGDPYKPAGIRSYETSLRLRVLPALGHVRLTELRLPDVQDFTDRMLAEGLNASTIGCTLLPLRGIFARALSRGEVAVNPTAGVRLPAVRDRRDRFASPAEAAALIAAVPEPDRALWATAMYAGLRRGELQALRAYRIDLAAGLIHVERGWDAKEGEIETKSHNRRKVPIPAELREPLAAHLMRSGRRDRDLVFGLTDGSPFNPGAVTKRADTAWKAAGLERITLHECRHTYASLMDRGHREREGAEHVHGHASVTITYDRYGQLMPGNEDKAAALLDAYLQRGAGGAR